MKRVLCLIADLTVLGFTMPATASASVTPPPVQHSPKSVCPSAPGTLGFSQGSIHPAQVTKPGSLIVCVVKPSAPDKARTLEEFHRMHSASGRQRAAQPPATNPLLPHPIPSWCYSNTASTAWHDLTEGCFENAGEIELIQLPSGKVFGTVAFGYTLDEYLDSTTSTDWDVEISMGATAEDPPGVAESMVVSGDPEITHCVGGGSVTSVACHETLLEFPTQSFALGMTAEGYASFETSPIPQGNSDIVPSELGWQFEAGIPGVSSGANVGDGLAAECDNALPGYAVAGCRADPSSFIPIFVLSQGSHSDGAVARHIVGSITGGSLANNLQRTEDAAVQNANRAAACPSSFKRPAGYSCDEYPFASTQQGGSNYVGQKPFTLSFCQIPTITARRGSFSACMVPEAQNGYAGNALQNFYNLSRILPREATRVLYGSYFDVHMIP